ncbi:hypothetical protein RIF29_32065 [Crotalaria pallida]|uniref:Scarecrow-like protein 14 n=1 Tax=Crotalaria pallida TaxID=3830 RepID=A0AAN9EID7_CROPI
MLLLNKHSTHQQTNTSMTMDPSTLDLINSYHWDDDDHDHVQQYHDHDLDPLVPPPASASSATMTLEVEDTDFSETAKFITQILMEENVDHRPFYDPLSLQLTENSFFEALQHTTPLSPLDSTTTNTNSSDSGEFKHPSPDHTSVSAHHHAFEFNSIYQPISLTISDDRMSNLDSSISKLLSKNIFSNADSVSLFNRGLEEASRFLPPIPRLGTVFGSEEITKFPLPTPPHKAVMPPIETNRMEKVVGLKSRKNHEREGSDSEEEGRSNKQSATSVVDDDESESSEMFDGVLLNVGHMSLCSNERKPSSDEGKATTRTKKPGKKMETVDLRTLLILCAQAVSANDNRTANELLKQIRQHSSPFGDGSQRLAHYFAKALEARLVGNGTGEQWYTFLMSNRLTATEYLKAYDVFLSACPFKKFSHFFATKMILKAAIKAGSLHIIDFGIMYGFHWPMLIKFLSEREGGPPKLRITGVEFPQPGFRPAERIEETGRRLANYCKRFKVPFEYHAIASRNWETIRVEDLKIESNQFLSVNCLMRFKNLLDDTIEANSPRNAVLHLIRKINPDIFVQSIVNGSYNAPFFATRFREALFHFSALYDMCDTVIPHENEWRMMMEREIIGREAMNVVACEGFERVERPETYKQWQDRNTRAGFRQLPLNKELMAKFRAKLREWYHRDFVFDEDGNWMLQGWKGRILYASSCWVPT